MEPFSPSPIDSEPRHINPSYSSPRTRIKVQMQGFAVGRAVDLMTMDGYDHLIDELDKLFDLNGELRSRDKWEIVYTDNEGDMMLVGDDPWPEFCNMAKRLLIWSSQDVKKMMASLAEEEGDTTVLSADSSPKGL